MAIIRGTALADLLYGLFAGDRISGFGGADSIFGDPGRDILAGGAGNDVIEGSFGNDRITGDDGDDSLTDQGSGSDSIFGGKGNDNLYVQHFAFAGAGNVLMDGGSGNDRLTFSGFFFDGENVTIRGGDGADIVSMGDAASSLIDPGAGNNLVSFNAGTGSHILDFGNGLTDAASIFPASFGANDASFAIRGFTPGKGGDFLDVFTLTASSFTGLGANANPFSAGYLKLLQRGSDAILRVDFDGGGNDFRDLVTFEDVQARRINAFNLGWDPRGAVFGGQTVDGTAEIDFLFGYSGNDVVNALQGNDMLWGGRGNDRLFGGDGDDEMQGQAGNDTLRGGRGNDVINEFLGGNDKLFGEDGNDTLILSAPAGAGPFQSSMDAGAGNDNIMLNAFVAPIDVTINGGAGDDTITISNKAPSASGLAAPDGPAEADGNTTITDTSGNNLIVLNALGDTTNITLGDGQNVIQLGSANFDGIRIDNFDSGAGGDVIELTPAFIAALTSLPQNGNPYDPDHGLFKLVRSNDDTLVLFDFNGTVGGQNFTPLVTLDGVRPSSLTPGNLGGFDKSGSVAGQAITGDERDNFLCGGPGTDSIFGKGGNDFLKGGGGADRLFGEAGNDKLQGGFGDGVMRGGEGDDDIFDQGGADIAYGEDGNDGIQFLRFFGKSEAVTVELDGGRGNDYITFGGGSSIKDSLKIFGREGNDRIVAQSGVVQTLINAGIGNDQISINAGRAVHDLTLGAGRDVVTIGYDALVLGANGEIRITDFASGAAGDRVQFQDYLSRALSGWNPNIDPFASGQARLVQLSGGAELQYSSSPGGSWNPLILFENVQASSLTAQNIGGYTPVVAPLGAPHDGADFLV